MWVKGFLLNEKAYMNDKVTIETYTGRIVEGSLIEINPTYHHSYGDYIPELSYIGKQLRNILGGEDSE
jgi:hypothetical protein